jgi:hypothetical protein
MHLDIRYPIGLLLATYGAVLFAQGVFVRAAVLGVNIDLYWGAFMAVCGVTSLYFARRARRRRRHAAVVNAPTPATRSPRRSSGRGTGRSR